MMQKSDHITGINHVILLFDILDELSRCTMYKLLFITAYSIYNNGNAAARVLFQSGIILSDSPLKPLTKRKKYGRILPTEKCVKLFQNHNKSYIGGFLSWQM